jgi:chromosome segregation protein
MRLHSPPDYAAVTLEKRSEDIKVISRRTSDERHATVLSSGQRAALAISIFWTLNLYGAKIPPVMLMDEPIQQIDDLNTLNFLDSLRWITEKGNRQIILSTANSRLAGLIKRKFSYLDDDYAEVHIERTFGMTPFINCRNGSGEIFYESAPKRLAG